MNATNLGFWIALLASTTAAGRDIRLATVLPSTSPAFRVLAAQCIPNLRLPAGWTARPVSLYALGLDEPATVNRLKTTTREGVDPHAVPLVASTEDIALVTGNGLTSWNREMFVLHLPFQLESAEVAGVVIHHVLGEYAKKAPNDLDDLRPVLGSLFMLGPVHLFSSMPLENVSDLLGVPFFSWHGDGFTFELLTALGASPRELRVFEVDESLRGLDPARAISALYSVQGAAVAAGWVRLMGSSAAPWHVTPSHEPVAFATWGILGAADVVAEIGLDEFQTWSRKCAGHINKALEQSDAQARNVIDQLLRPTPVGSGARGAIRETVDRMFGKGSNVVGEKMQTAYRTLRNCIAAASQGGTPGPGVCALIPP